MTSVLSILGGSFLYADQIAVSDFKYLNSNQNSTIIDPAAAQDLLNVNVSPGGKSVLKRQGYGVYKTLTPSTGLHGGYHAFTATGSDYQLWGTSVSLYGITADGTPVQIVSSATVNTTWDCTDTQGNSYCVNSSRNAYIKTDGATLGSWQTSPLGTMIESTPDRVVVAGVAASPNTLFVSQSNTFTNYTVGVLNTDAFQEVIAAPGSHLTHIRWGCQRLLWWKDQSFGYFDFDDQYAAQVKIVSDNIGTLDNSSAADPGGNIWFRGQDGHTYRYDCSALEKMTVDITPQIQSSGRRTTNFWQQSTQADWQSGSIVPTAQLSTTISEGDVIVSSYQVNEFSSASGWNVGTSSNFAVGTSSLSLTTNNTGNVTNNDFESAFSGNWTGNAFGTGTKVASIVDNCTINPQTGSAFARFTYTHAEIFDAFTGVLLSSVAVTFTADCAWRQATIPHNGNIGKRFKVQFATDPPSSGTFTTADSYVLGGDITFYYAETSHSSPSFFTKAIDNVQNGSSTITVGSFTSQVFNTSLTSSTIQAQSVFTVGNGAVSFLVLTATSNPSNNWISLLTSSGTNGVGNKYVKYVSSVTIGSTDNSYTTYISSISVVARSSGTFYSAWKNAPSWSAWSTFNPTYVDNGGSHAFFVRASTSPQSVLNSTVAWVSQSANSQVATSTSGIYFQIRDDFSITAATSTPTLNDFTVNWFEGNASDQAYLLYFDNAIWESVTYGTGVSSNTYIFRYDLINDGWGLYNFGAGGMLIQGNRLYFGSVNDGNIFQFGSGASDNGNSINAFWRSKSFGGNDPFMQNQLMNIDVFAKKDSGSTLTSTYTMDTSTATAYTISLSTANAFVQSRKLLPSGKLGYVFDQKIGDFSSSSQWELFGFRVGYTQLPYRPTTP